MSKGFEGAKGPWSYTASIPQDGAECFWIVGHDGRDIGAVDGPQTDEREALARLIAEAGTVLHETGLTPRQLAEQRAELLEALKRLYGCYSTSHSPATRESCWDQARTAIANATQQRNATGGEG